MADATFRHGAPIMIDYTPAAGDVDAGDIVLVKGSKGTKLSLVVDVLRKLGQAVAQDHQGID